MKNKIMVSISIVFLVLSLTHVTLNFMPNVSAEPTPKEVFKVLRIDNTGSGTIVIDVNVTLNSRNGVYMAASNDTTTYFENEAYWNGLGYATYMDWLNGTSTLPYHWGEMNWNCSSGSTTAISYDNIQQWGDLYSDSGGGVSYTTFMNSTYMADWNLSRGAIHNDPDIIGQGNWYSWPNANTIKMVDDVSVAAGNSTWIVFKIVLTVAGNFTFNLAPNVGVPYITIDGSTWIQGSTWTIGGADTFLVPLEYGTIQGAVNAAWPNATIFVASGTYHENQIVIAKPLKLFGSGPSTTIIDGDGASLSTVGLIRITANTGDVTFNNFTVQNAGPCGGVRVGIYASSDTAGFTYTISNNKIYGTNDPGEADDYGFYSHGGKENIVFTRNLITQTGANSILIEQHEGSTEISHNTLDVGAYGTDSIFFMTYGGVDVTTLQNVSYNTFDMGTGADFDYAHRATGISFCSVYPVLGTSPEANFTSMVISGNTFNNLKSNRRGIGFWNAGSGDNLISPFITNNTINGVAGSDDNYGIDFYGLTNGTTIFNNTISGTEVAIYLRDGDAPGTRIRYNNIAGNVIGVDWTIGSTSVEASYNWWGNETGPGDQVSSNVLYEPWLIKPYPPATPVSVIYVNPKNTVLETPSWGQPFTVNVVITNVSQMYAFQFTLKWDSSLINLTNPTTAVIVPSAWHLPPIYSYNLIAGWYSGSATAAKPESSISGTATLGTFTFRSVSDPIYPDIATCGITLENVIISDINTTKLPRLVYSGNYSCNSAKAKLVFNPKEYSAQKVPTEFDAYVNATNAVNLASYTFEVKFNSTLLYPIELAVTYPGPDRIKLIGADTVFVNVSGIDPAINGTAVLARIRFKVYGIAWNNNTQLISSTLNFTNGKFNNADVEEVINATYVYRPLPGDLNMDGVVDILDLAAAAKAFGTSLGETGWLQVADLNCDDTINILDIVLIARNFGAEAP